MAVIRVNDDKTYDIINNIGQSVMPKEWKNMPEDRKYVVSDYTEDVARVEKMKKDYHWWKTEDVFYIDKTGQRLF